MFLWKLFFVYQEQNHVKLFFLLKITWINCFLFKIDEVKLTFLVVVPFDILLVDYNEGYKI
jgi:hypothetical protein